MYEIGSLAVVKIWQEI